jgi:hypothetical protein
MGLQAQGGAGTGLGPATESALRESFEARSTLPLESTLFICKGL